MPIIIIATDLDEPQAVPQAVQAPLAPTPVPQAPTPQATPVPVPVQPELATRPQTTASLIAAYVGSYEPAQRAELRKAIYVSGQRNDVLNAIAEAYQGFSGNERDDLIELVYNSPDEFSGTVGKWLEKARKEHFDDPGYEARSMIWRAMLNWKPGQNLADKLAQAFVGSKTKSEVGSIGQAEARNLNEAKAALAPYLKFLNNPDNPPPGWKKVDKDVIDKITSWSFSEEDAAWEQYERDHDKEKIPYRAERASKAMLPYIKFLQDPDSPPAGSKQVDQDLVDKLNEIFSEDDAVWEQYKRDYWLDLDEEGPGRVDRAKKWWVQELSKIKEKEAASGLSLIRDVDVKPAINSSTIKFANMFLPVRTDLDPDEISKRMTRLQNPPATLIGKGPRLNIGKNAISNPSWLPLSDLYLREYGISEANKYNPGMLPFDDWLIGKLKALKESGTLIPESVFMPRMDFNWYGIAKDALARNGYQELLWKPVKSGIAPRSLKVKPPKYWLTSQMVDPTKGGINKSYIKHVRDLMVGPNVSLTGTSDDDMKPFDISIEETAKAPDKNEDISNDPFNVGNIDMFMGALGPAERKTFSPQRHWMKPGPDNPRFKDIIFHIVKNLYSPFSTQEGQDETRQRTEAVLYEIGRFYSKLQGSSGPQDMRQVALGNEEIETEVLDRLKRQNLLDEPLALKHVEDDSTYSEDQRYYLALREVVADIMNYILQHGSELSQMFGLEQKKVGEIAKRLKTAAFLVAFRQIGRVLSAPKAEVPCLSLRK